MKKVFLFLMCLLIGGCATPQKKIAIEPVIFEETIIEPTIEEIITSKRQEIALIELTRKLKALKDPKEPLSDSPKITVRQRILSLFNEDQQLLLLAMESVEGELAWGALLLQSYNLTVEEPTIEGFFEYLWKINEEGYKKGHSVYATHILRNQLDEIWAKYKLLKWVAAIKEEK